MEKVVIIDYGMGNLHSVFSALKQVDDGQRELSISQNRDEILAADKVIFPGQGAAADCMRALQDLNLADLIGQLAEQKPFLGICMGMQVLLGCSEENDGTECLGLYSGEVKNFSREFKVRSISPLKVPHMGWNNIRIKQAHPLWEGLESDSYFYFVHSYYVNPANDSLITGSTDYGFEFASVIASGKVFAMQCHPEKSGENGLKLLHNFLQWDGTV